MRLLGGSLTALLTVFMIREVKVMGEKTIKNEKIHNISNTFISHLVFFGDSLLRYQYLTYVYKLHFGSKTTVPSFLINEKMFTNWNQFFINTTSIFNGSMTCDCFREASVKRLTTARENRRYIHPSGKLIVSYYPLMGYFPVQGMNDSSIIKNFGHYVTQPDWYYSTPFTFVEKHLSSVEPRPSVIFVNSGHWNNKIISKKPRKLLMKLQDVVLFGSAGSDMKGKCVAWLGTTKPNIPWWPGSRDADWNIVKGRFCHETLDGNKERPVTASHINDEHILNICVFVPFNFQTNSSDYFDHMHFSNEGIYHNRTLKALKACNLLNTIYSTI